MKSKPQISGLPRIRQTPKTGGDHQEQIRRRAYELYEQRGRSDGFAPADSLQAESELTKSKAKRATASE